MTKAKVAKRSTPSGEFERTREATRWFRRVARHYQLGAETRAVAEESIAAHPTAAGRCYRAICRSLGLFNRGSKAQWKT